MIFVNKTNVVQMVASASSKDIDVNKTPASLVMSLIMTLLM